MIEDLFKYLPEILSLTGAVAAIVGALLVFTQLRRTRYETELNHVRLDHSRIVLEREIEKLHEQIYRDGSRLSEMNHLLLDSIRSKTPSTSGEHLDIGLSGSAFLKSMGLDPASLAIDPDFVFVLTPLNSNQLNVYNIVKKECEKIGLRVRRGDEKRIEGPILPHILKEIATSRLVVANINGRNPNVFYELGIAQALGKPVLLVVKSYDEVPFDLRQQQLVIYDDIKSLPEEFAKALSRYALSSGK
jgi:hypothetical protein